jgi:Cof subfamily protein (haloacid dehalogenase superfamily)
MSLPRLVATDLDGTLLHTDGTVSDRTSSVLREVLDRGVEVVFVTARPLRWMDDLWHHVGDRGTGIVSNGAITYDIERRKVISAQGIDAAVGIAMAEAIRAAVPGTGFALESLSGFSREESYVDLHEPPPGFRTGTLAELWDEPAVKILAQHSSLAPEEFRNRVIEAVGEVATPTWTLDGLVEISASGVTKGAALARLCEVRGVDPGDVVAFGDMPNDLPMLTWAGTSYAVANAHPSVREAADHVAPANDDDGVAAVLAELFGL